MEGGKEQNYWPAFVDALSNVVLTLVFVLVIFVFALVMASSKMEERIRDQIENEQKQAEVVTPPQEVLKDEQTLITVAEKIPEKAKQGTVKIEKFKAGIVLVFPIGITEMDDASAAELTKVFEEHRVREKHMTAVRSVVGKEAYSIARRLAYYRAVGVRSYLISKLGENPGDLIVSLVEPPQPEDGRVEITFQKE